MIVTDVSAVIPYMLEERNETHQDRLTNRREALEIG